MGEEQTALGCRTEPSHPPDWSLLGYPGNRITKKQIKVKKLAWQNILTSPDLWDSHQILFGLRVFKEHNKKEPGYTVRFDVLIFKPNPARLGSAWPGSGVPKAAMSRALKESSDQSGSL